MSDPKKVTITFAPGAFDNFDGTQEELDELVRELERMAGSGELDQHSIDLDTHDDWDSVSDRDREQIQQALADMANSTSRRLH